MTKRKDAAEVPSAPELFDDVTRHIRRFVVLTPAQATTLTLWIAHTHAFAAADCTPYMRVSSAEPQCGKTRLLEVAELLVANPWLTGRTTGPALQRKVSAETPTLMLDETDALFHGNSSAEMVRGMLNTGYRQGGKTTVAEGSNGAEGTRDYNTFCPKAFAGIGKLPDTIMSRSVSIRLQRRTREETVERFRRRDVKGPSTSLKADIAIWALDNIEALTGARPELPDELSDRAQDVWEPLLAIADRVGGEWPKKAREAASELSGRQAVQEQSTGQVLLTDIHTIFEGSDRLRTERIVNALHDLPEAPWASYRGRGLNQRDLGSILGRYGLKSHTVRFGDETAMGYDKADFAEVWTRYVFSEAE